MKRFIGILVLFISFCAAAQMDEIISKRPSPPRLVNDFTRPSTLTQDQKQALEEKLVAYDDSTSNQVAIVIVHTLNGYSVEEAALQILRGWGVGSKKNNNGVVILVAKDDRKIRIETGYGLESAIPDLTANSIIDNDIKPNFKAGNYYQGLDQAVDALIKAAAGEYKAPEGYGERKKKGISFVTIIIIIIILVIIFGGMANGPGGGYVSRRGYTGWGGGGWIGGGGGGWSGGGGSGGFGGFGGGSGGGGGASGSW